MSTFRNPVGPQPTSVYWRRRLVVALGLVAVIVVIAVIVFLPRGATTADPTSSASPAASDDVADSGAAVDPSPSVEPVAGAPCDPAVVTVAAITDTNNYAAEQLPQLGFAVTNTGTVPCTFNVGTTQQTFVVTSGAEQYWSSKDCETGPVDSELTLEPNVAVNSTPIPWDRTRSSTSTCDTARTAVPAGGATYNLDVTLGAVPVSTTSFILN